MSDMDERPLYLDGHSEAREHGSAAVTVERVYVRSPGPPSAADPPGPAIWWFGIDCDERRAQFPVGDEQMQDLVRRDRLAVSVMRIGERLRAHLPEAS